MADNGVHPFGAGVDDVGQNPKEPFHSQQQWRKNKIKWTPEYRQQMLEKVLHYEPEGPSVKQARILLLGQIGSGKSSYFNTIGSITKGRITQRAPMGSAEHSLTVKYKEYDFRKPHWAQDGAGDGYTRFQLCDTMGMEVESGLHKDDIMHMLDGRVPEGYQFNPTSGMADDAKGFRKNPSLNDKVHCVVLVIDASVCQVINPAILAKLRDIRTFACKRGIPMLALLTKVDRVCQECEGNLSGVFHCSQLAGMVAGLAEKLGLPQNCIVPVKSYESENDLETNVDILALNSLMQMLNCCDDCLEEYITRPPPAQFSDEKNDMRI